jgi:hypothetical protein
VNGRSKAGCKDADAFPRVTVAAVLCLTGALGVAGCWHDEVAATDQGMEPTSRPMTVVVLADPPAMTEGQYPCSDCHDPELPPRPKRRALKQAHEEIVLAHGGERTWCWDCHDLEDRDQLRLAGGDLVPYAEAHVVCGQCHGDQLRDWQGGAHGKSTGSFQGGTRTILRCATCHDAHAPHFKPLQPMAPPKPSRRTR